MTPTSFPPAPKPAPTATTRVMTPEDARLILRGAVLILRDLKARALRDQQRKDAA